MTTSNGPMTRARIDVLLEYGARRRQGDTPLQALLGIYMSADDQQLLCNARGLDGEAAFHAWRRAYARRHFRAVAIRVRQQQVRGGYWHDATTTHRSISLTPGRAVRG